MLLEVKIMTGARAGQTKRLEKPVITVGRNPDVDIRFDPLKDLDVSGKHAEFRRKGPGYELFDLASTNGTFVNGERVNGSVIISTADTVRFGANGPEVEVSFHVTGDMKVVGATEERIAMAVKKQTAGLRRMVIGGMGVIALGVAAAYLVGQRASAKEVERMRSQLAENDARLRAMANGMAGDTALANAFQRRLSSLSARLTEATTDEERKKISADMKEIEDRLATMVRMDLPTVNSRNAPGVALLISLIKTSRTDSSMFSGTAFAITPSGLMLTNRHNVRDANGNLAAKIAIKFRDDSNYYPARIVKVPPMGDSLDLAVIQLEDSLATWPTVMGIQAHDDNAAEGSAVAIIGFPLGYETAQDGGSGGNFIAKTSVIGGTVSKRTTSILQIDSYAAHGSSGSPVISAKGLVIGVVWGGPRDAGGRIVYAVPLDRILGFLPDKARSAIRD
jgi:S1-C subfamily serine protease